MAIDLNTFNNLFPRKYNVSINIANDFKKIIINYDDSFVDIFNIYYDFFHNDKLLHVFFLKSEEYNGFKYVYADVGDANLIKIKNGNSNYHKIIEIEKQPNDLLLKKDGVVIDRRDESTLIIEK